MSFDSFSEFIAMGGHGPFVWGAYGIAFVVILLNFVLPVLQKRKYLARIRDAEQTVNRQEEEVRS